MADGLYLRANGELGCWGHFGDIKRLDRVDVAKLRDPKFDLIGHPELVAIRRAFRRGRLPFPELCPKCPVLGGGVAEAIRPRRLDKLLIEPSYLCQLDCPACFSASKRRRRGSPPYLLEPELLQAFLDRLRSDGVESVRFVHLEGRGDPMMGPHTWTLTRAIKAAFPEVEMQMTSHGVYDFDPEVFDSGLDVLRFSIDGATPESYGRYRRGGDFHRVLDHLRAIRDHRRRYRSRLRMVWKYIVFEWNDSSEELALAARLADELEAEMLFVLAEEGTGRSKRLPDMTALGEELARVAPRSVPYECLDQLGTAELHEADHARQHAAATAYRQALVAQAEGHRWNMLRWLREGLSHDPGLPRWRRWTLSTVDPLPSKVVEIAMETVRNADTLAALANLAVQLGRWQTAYRLFRRYLQVGPEAPDRETVEAALVHLALCWRLGTADLSGLDQLDHTQLLQAETAILRVDPGHRPGGPATASEPVDAWIDDVTLPASLHALGLLRAARGDASGAHQLLARVRAETPDAMEQVSAA